MTTQRENLLRTLRRQGFEEVPVDISMCPSQVEAFEQRFGHADVASYFRVPYRYCIVPMLKQFQDPATLYPREQLPAEISFDAWGVGHSRQADCFHMTRMHHPLAGDISLDELSAYPYPVVASDAVEKTCAAVRELHAQGLAAVAGMACTVWETAWYMRSMEDLMVDMMTDDERAIKHLDTITAIAEQRAGIAAQAGCDIIAMGDDVGMQQTTMLSLEMWEKWLKPRLARVIRRAREIKPDILIFYHSCGYVLPFIDGLIEAGVDVLNPLQPECMDFDEVHALAAGRLSFWGTIGTQRLLPFGTPAEVKEAVLHRLRKCGAAGGIVIAPTHLVEPEVPWKNLQAMADAAASYRP